MAFEHFCDSCPYFEPKESAPNTWVRYAGVCRKNAPYGQGDSFPQVCLDDWCGQHPKNSIPDVLVTMEREHPTDNVINGFATRVIKHMDKASKLSRRGI